MHGHDDMMGHVTRCAVKSKIKTQDPDSNLGGYNDACRVYEQRYSEGGPTTETAYYVSSQSRKREHWLS